MRLKPILLLAPAFLLGGCALLDPKRAEPPPARVIVQPAPPSEADLLLAYLSQMRKHGTREIAVEREKMRAMLQVDKNDFNCIKLAILLTLSPPLPTGPAPTAASLQANDDAELMLLLRPLLTYQDAPNVDSTIEVAKAAAREDIRSLATLLYIMAQERTKWRDQWRESQARINALRRDDSKELEARALRVRVEELERKLAALKSIDRSVNRRTEVQRVEPPRADTPK